MGVEDHEEALSIRVIGQGYVGLPIAVLAAEAALKVVGIDIDSERVRRLRGGESVVEDISDARLRAVIASGCYEPSDDPSRLAGFDVAIISVPTPLRDRQPNLAFVEAAAAAVSPHVTRGATIILESTTYPGTTEEIVKPLLEAGCGLAAGKDFHLGYSPERIDPGNRVWPLESIPRVVSGIDADSLRAVASFFRRVGITTVAARGTREAELAKLLENTFRHVNIALVNELAIFAHELDIDVWDTVRIAATKPFGFMTFTPGPGVGGHCLPIDPSYLSWRVERRLGHTFRFVELANDVNNHMPDYVVRRVVSGLSARGVPLRGSSVLLLGLTYKPGTADTREAPSYRIAELLVRGGATVEVADPRATWNATPVNTVRVRGDATDLARADAILLLVDHPEFDLSYLEAARSFVLDCRGVTTSSNVERL